MRARLIDPSKLVYCYHYGEPLDYLIKALESGIDYVALGGVARKGKVIRNEFFTQLEPIFEQYPHVHVHAFGMTALDILDRYTYIDSSDSSSWLYPAKYARIETASCKQVYFGGDLTKPINIKEAYENLSTTDKALLLREIESLGMTLEDMYTNIGRSDWQLLYWQQRMKKVKR